MIRIDSTAYSTVANGDFPTERRDCSVRALAIALGIPYREAHESFRIAGRRHGEGTPLVISAWVHKRHGMETMRPFRPTLAQFLRENPKGRFVVHRRGHAFAIIDGVVHDWERGTGARSRIQNAWRVPTNGLARGV